MGWMKEFSSLSPRKMLNAKARVERRDPSLARCWWWRECATAWRRWWRITPKMNLYFLSLYEVCRWIGIRQDVFSVVGGWWWWWSSPQNNKNQTYFLPFYPLARSLDDVTLISVGLCVFPLAFRAPEREIPKQLTWSSCCVHVLVYSGRSSKECSKKKGMLLPLRLLGV